MATRRLPFAIAAVSSEAALSRENPDDRRATLMLRQEEEDETLARRTRAALNEAGGKMVFIVPDISGVKRRQVSENDARQQHCGNEDHPLGWPRRRPDRGEIIRV